MPRAGCALCGGCDQCSNGACTGKIKYASVINITTSTQGTHKPLRRPCRCAVSLAKNASEFIPATTVAAGQGRWEGREGLPEKMRTDCRIRNGSCYNDANDTSSQMLKFSVAPELPAPSTAVTADESFGSGSLPSPPLGPPACLPNISIFRT